MSIWQTVAPYDVAASSRERSLAEEVRELHKLATDRRAASLTLFRDSQGSHDRKRRRSGL